MNFPQALADVEKEIEETRALLQHFLSSDMDIDKLTLDEFLDYSDGEISNIGFNQFVSRWMDYRVLLAKRQTLLMCQAEREKELKAILFKLNNTKGFEIQDYNDLIKEITALLEGDGQ